MVLDLDVVRDNYTAFARSLPDTRVFYAVKANPAPEVLSPARRDGLVLRHRLRRRDGEVVLGRRRPPTGSPSATRSMKERCIGRALKLGIRLFAVDCQAEVEKIARAAVATDVPTARSGCSAASCATRGRRLALSRKFGCVPEMAADVLEHAHRQGLEAYGISFHVGSPAGQHRGLGWGARLRGGDLPRVRGARDRPVDGQSRRRLPDQVLKAGAGRGELRRGDLPGPDQAFRQPDPETIIEPGRGMVGNAGLIEAEVVLVSKKSADADEVRWVYLDIGKFGGLAETWTRRSATRSAPPGTATRPSLASSPGRPATRWTCSTSGSSIRCRSRSRSATRC